MKKVIIEIKWAIVFTLMMLAWMGIERALGLHGEHIDKQATYTNLVAIPAILIYVLALINKRERYYNGVMTYGQGFISGLVLTAFITLLVPVSQYITLNYITPDYFENAIAYGLSENQGTELELRSFFNADNYLMLSVVSAFIIGIITTAIVAIFVRKKAA